MTHSTVKPTILAFKVYNTFQITLGTILQCCFPTKSRISSLLTHDRTQVHLYMGNSFSLFSNSPCLLAPLDNIKLTHFTSTCTHAIPSHNFPPFHFLLQWLSHQQVPLRSTLAIFLACISYKWVHVRAWVIRPTWQNSHAKLSWSYLNIIRYFKGGYNIEFYSRGGC